MRAKLRFRLAGFVVNLPPLRKRTDLKALATRFLARADPALQLAPNAMDRLAAHDWPGNLHELRATLSRAALRATGGHVHATDLDGLPDAALLAAPVCGACAGTAWKEQQCRSIRSQVNRLGGSISSAARELGMSRTTIYKHVARSRPSG